MFAEVVEIKYNNDRNFENYIKLINRGELSLCDIPIEDRIYRVCMEAVKYFSGNFECVDATMQTDEMCLEAVRYNGELIKLVSKQKRAICLAAVKNNGMALRYVKKQDYDICLAAVKSNGLALQFVKNQTDEICLAAVKKNPMALEWVKNQTDEICLAAVSGGYALMYVKNQTEEICLASVCHNGSTLEYVKNQTNEICLAAVKKDGISIKFVKNQTDEICLAAVSGGYALMYVKNQTEEICLAAVRQNGMALEYVENQTEEICLAAIKNTPNAIRYVKNQTEEMCLIAINYDPLNICHIKTPSDAVILAASSMKPSFYNHDFIAPFLRNPNKTALINILNINGLMLRHMKNHDLEMYKAAIKNDPRAITYVDINIYEYDCKDIISAFIWFKKTNVNVTECGFSKKLAEILSKLEDEDLVEALEVHFECYITKDVLDKCEYLFNLKQKINMMNEFGITGGGARGGKSDESRRFI